jgi:hypothetical protein
MKALLEYKCEVDVAWGGRKTFNKQKRKIQNVKSRIEMIKVSIHISYLLSDMEFPRLMVHWTILLTSTT